MCASCDDAHPFLFPLEVIGLPVGTVEILTPHGSFQLIESVTLGEMLTVLAVLLLVSFLVVKWLLETVWRKGGR